MAWNTGVRYGRVLGLAAMVLAGGSVPAFAQPRPTASSPTPPPPDTRPATGADPPIQIIVDATEAPRRIFHTAETIWCKPGPMTLVYAKWIPGEHGPTGPIVNVAGLRVTAGGKPVEWQRDLVDMYSFHLDVPAGADKIDVWLDYLSPQLAEGFSASPATTAHIAVIDWHLMLLYPKGKPADQIMVSARLRAPKGWKEGGALTHAMAGRNADDDTMMFNVVPLTTLIDTPVVLGEHYREVELLGASGTTPRHVIDIVADSERALEIPVTRLEQYRRLVLEETSMFGASHYEQYHFLLSLSDHLSSFGLEHHQCSDDRAGEKFLIDDQTHRLGADLLPHEMFHSWNGKAVRPAGLIIPDYQEPMKTDLLWVYEGLTQYYGTMMAARAGFWTPEEARENLAVAAAGLDTTSGRTWRPLQDTATAAQILYEAPGDWAIWRRGVDFYDEGTLIWLEADVTIRQKTGGAKSLDDFCRAFHGAGGTGKVLLRPYTADDVYAALNQVAQNDWKAFFESRLRSTDPHAPLGGLAGGGWKLVYSDSPNEFITGPEEHDEALDLRFSLGLRIKKDGTIKDAAPGMAAYAAGLGPGMKIVAVSAHRFSFDAMKEAVHAAAGSKEPIELVVDNTDSVSTRRVEYHGGMRFPHLQRDEGSPDLLADILRPHAAAVK